MQARSATLRIQIEHALERSFPAALSPAQRTLYETASTGIAEVDALLGGGLPVGAISEVNGPESSGRTSLALSFLAQRTAAGQVCAWVDAGDAFDPESAAANGVNLRQLLWVRCMKAGGAARNRQAAKPWTQLDQALRATDLLLQAGGFAAIVLDLGDTAAEYACRIPLATWFRFRQAADRARTCLLVVVQAGCAQSSAAAALECAALSPVTAGGTVLRGFHFEVRRERQRVTPFAVGQRKPPASAWQAVGAWDAAGAEDTAGASDMEQSA
jgi:recombination protein RecA